MADNLENGPQDEFEFYFSVRLDGKAKNALRVFRLASSLEEAESFAKESGEQEELFDNPASTDEIDYGEEERDLSSIASFCEEQMGKFFHSLAPFHDLVQVSSYVRPLLVNAGMESVVLAKVRERCHQIRKTDEIETYGVSGQSANEIIQIISRIQQMDNGLSILPSSALLSLVATFDSLIGDATKAFLRLHPDKMINSDKTVTYRELLSLGSLEDAKSRFVNEEVDKLLRGNHDDQVQYLEKMIDTKIRESYTRWPNFIEIFERRNIVAHSNGNYSQIYISKCKSAGYPCEGAEIGLKAPLKQKYLHKSINILSEFGVLLWFVAWRKLDSSSESKAFSRLNSIAFEAIKSFRYELAVWLLDFGLYRQPRNADDMTTRMMFINLANAYKKMKRPEKCRETLAEADWSATSDLFSLALASLNDDTERAATLVKNLARSEKLRPDDFRDWPVFDWIRGDSAVAKAFEEGFGEPLVMQMANPSQIESASSPSSETHNETNEGESPPDETLH